MHSPPHLKESQCTQDARVLQQREAVLLHQQLYFQGLPLEEKQLTVRKYSATLLECWNETRLQIAPLLFHAKSHQKLV